jgi:hypothetical protein
LDKFLKGIEIKKIYKTRIFKITRKNNKKQVKEKKKRKKIQRKLKCQKNGVRKISKTTGKIN